MSFVYKIIGPFLFWSILFLHPADKKRAEKLIKNSKFYESSFILAMIIPSLTIIPAMIAGPLPTVITLVLFMLSIIQFIALIFLINREDLRLQAIKLKEKEDILNQMRQKAGERETRFYSSDQWYRVRDEFYEELTRRAKNHERMERARQEAARKWDEEQMQWKREDYYWHYPPPSQPQRSARDLVIEKNLKILGLPLTCRDFDTIKRQYRRLMKEYHPDNNSSQDAANKMKSYLAAYRAIEDVMK